MQQALEQEFYRAAGARIAQVKRQINQVYTRLGADLEEMLNVNVVGVDLDDLCDDAEIRINKAGRQVNTAHQKLEDDLVVLIRCFQQNRKRDQTRKRAEEQKRKEEERHSRLKEEKERREKEHRRKEFERRRDEERQEYARHFQECRWQNAEKASREEMTQDRSKNTQNSKKREPREAQGNSDDAERDRLYQGALKSVANLTERNRDLSATIKTLQEELQNKSGSLVAQSWNTYEALWNHLSHPSLHLSFAAISWPMHPQPKTPSDITALAVSDFLFSNPDSQDRTRKDKIKAALLRWHPDKFARVMSRVQESDRALVEEGVGIVVRHLNDELSKES
ncbi:hypothetical protein JAAARDRAFT_38252 [Jaapia argillacea MUCL 33604]|uniref:Uncharacterized protein n=1 Tax=Jaapia argillacea MUCL 33604 TaxID=933084 RepID=A0A067PIF7_9AGAM|nr:hypothetical protein JAAARDRAFT_38252 [Jaapia argillacea MUCL 33604]